MEKTFQFWVLAAVSLYIIISVLIFNKVYEASRQIVDEQFHIPQGIRFCQFNFTYWDPKITTLPGLYIISTILLGPFTLCTTYWLRLVNLAFSVINFLLFLNVIRSEEPENKFDLKVILQAFNLAILPPLYFFSHVYYTDCMAITFVFLFMLAAKYKYYKLMTISSIFSILVRQTNVVWIAGYLGSRAIEMLYSSYAVNVHTFKKTSNKKFIKNRFYQPIKNFTLEDLFRACIYHMQTKFRWIIRSTSCPEVQEIKYGTVAVVAFGMFVFYNGAIVVGDKEAHIASVHFPQFLYFLLFYSFFGLIPVANNLKSVVRKLATSKIVNISLVVVLIIAIKYNTLVHPYLLADNRHYTFYIWNRFYGKYWFAKYIIIPVYVLALTSMTVDITKSQSYAFVLYFELGCTATVCLQKMIDIRYFLFPFIIFRLKSPLAKWWVISIETFFYLTINFLYFRTFFTKEIYWKDFEDVQRLMW